MKFTIVRHGETVANQHVLLSGHKDTPLTEGGLAQARKVAARLQNEKFTAAYSSDLSRAFQTKEEILKFHPQVPKERLAILRERSFGDFEEKPVSLHFSTLKSSGLPLWQFSPPNGETLLQVKQRALDFISSLNHGDEAHILIVGHFSINKTLIHSLLAWEWDSWETLIQGNTCVNIIEKQDTGYHATLLNCTKHLE